MLGRLIFGALATLGVIFTSDPQVIVQQGKLKGKTIKSFSGRTFFAFQGVPYAAPPVGNLRFKAPQTPAPWQGERLAQSEGHDCVQTHVLFHWDVGKEDCLYLNVYTPKLESEGAGLSVMVWIHGGGFFSGSGSTEFYGPKFFLDHDIVLVTINYRIGPLGFLSMGTPEAPGNYGLKDQVAALRWVQNNVAKFGGNPDSVTIFGESAGGGCVQYLMHSPLAKGLFHRVIAQSGSALNPTALEHEPAKLGAQAARALGCKQRKASALMRCLRAVEPQRFAKMDLKFRADRKEKTVFVPVVEPPGTEGAVLSDTPQAMLARGDIADVPLMAGLVTHEGMLDLMLLRGRTIEQTHMDNFHNVVPEEQGVHVAKDSPEWSATWQRVENFYTNISGGDLLEHFLLVHSDLDFVLGVDDLVRGVAALRRSPVYYYQFSYDGGFGTLKSLAGVNKPGATAHTDELNYMFNNPLFSPLQLLTANSADRRTVARVTKLWTDFARNGNPTPDGKLGVRWDPVEAPLHEPKMATTRYLDIGEQLVMEERNLNGERVAFWQNLRDNVPQLSSR